MASVQFLQDKKHWLHYYFSIFGKMCYECSGNKDKFNWGLNLVKVKDNIESPYPSYFIPENFDQELLDKVKSSNISINLN